jgi:hypothetical protein
VEKLRSELEEIFAGGKWIIAAQAAVAAGHLQKLLTDWGSEPLVVASNEGTGDLPPGDIIYTRSGGDTVVGSIREFFASVEQPSPEVIAAVDRFDPDVSARVLAEPIATARTMLGRRTFGVRRDRWSAWEDKMRVDRLWDDLDIPHAPYRIVTPDAAAAAARELASDLGTVWVADNFEGWHGGGEYVKWVSGADECAATQAWFSGRARQVRVMPFLEGLPASIHGWVTQSGVAVFLPVEILILRHADRSAFVYTGVSTLWNAPESATREMRGVALRVGEALSERDDYRGPYGIDGVLTDDGFRPTELNPRMSAGAGAQLGSVDLPLGLLMRCEIEGLIEVDHRWLEEAVTSQRKPRIHLGKMVSKNVRDSMSVRRTGEGLIEVDDDAEAIGKLVAGPSATGSYIVGEFDVEKVGIGKPVGSLAADALNLASEKWALGLPELVAASSRGGRH